MRIVSSSDYNKTKVVDTYLMMVTDDNSNTVSYYEISRDAPNINDENKLAFNPKNTIEKFYGRLIDLGDGLGLKLELWNTDSGLDREERADITGDGEPDFIQIHVGGRYEKEGKKFIMGSLGCFGLNGKDDGNDGRDRFIDDISTRHENSGGK